MRVINFIADVNPLIVYFAHVGAVIACALFAYRKVKAGFAVKAEIMPLRRKAVAR